jgi:hypothetical protein
MSCRFNVGTNIDGATVRCILYSTMKNSETVKYGTASFKKVAGKPRFVFLEYKILHIRLKFPMAVARVRLSQKAIECQKHNSRTSWPQVKRLQKNMQTLSHVVMLCAVLPLASIHERRSRRLENRRETRRCVVSSFTKTLQEGETRTTHSFIHDHNYG